jgi:hypothetical protein
LRYILHRNPQRATEIAAAREDKYRTLCKAVDEHNHYLTHHPRAHVEVALRKLEERSKTVRIAEWVNLSIEARKIRPMDKVSLCRILRKIWVTVFRKYLEDAMRVICVMKKLHARAGFA